MNECIDCNEDVNGRNTYSRRGKRSARKNRCGKCYLKFKQKQRIENGEC